MANRHISVPKLFANGDASEWLKRFDICSRANEWSYGTKALKLLTLLEGEALATWLELSEEEQSHYRIAKKRMIKKIAPMKFVTLEEFHQRKLHPGEALPLFIHDLKKLLDRAMPDVDATARGQLLLHQFQAGLPAAVSTKWYAICTLHPNLSIVWWPCVALSTNGGKVDTSVGGELDCQNCEVRSTWELRMAGETRLFISIDCSITFSPITLNS